MADGSVQERPSARVRGAAAEKLAVRLKGLADQLAANGSRAKRVLYGRGSLKRLSPKGHLLDTVGPQLLLPDGRLWHYHTRRSPEGIYYNASTDHAQSMHGSIPLGGERFSFLGAVVRGYSFGYRHREDDASDFELGAIVGKSGVTNFVAIAEALDDISVAVSG